ncbi:hypothetical protein [Trueperella sp.]|uniref:hypothetical protein n=1 Tax=Trueperella sp. TaxID=2699835 RepID=UPI0022EB4B59|nr:hypothetical protein [Trueperella sp.]
MVAQDYLVDRIEASGSELCVFTDDDVLLVFSEEVTATSELDGIVADGVVYPLGSVFRAPQAQEISDGFMCAGKRYQALHIPGPGLAVPFP